MNHESAVTDLKVIALLPHDFIVGAPAEVKTGTIPRVDPMPRWAVITESGKQYRIYDHNRTRAAQRIKELGEKIKCVEPAGYWDARKGLVKPDWEKTTHSGRDA